MGRSFSKLAALAFVLVFTCGLSRSLFAQDNTDNNIIKPLTAQGSAAMIFQLGGLGNFGFAGPGIAGFSTGGVGMKYFISDDMALFILAGLNTASGSDSTPSTVSAKPSTTNFGIAAGIQKHFRPLYSTSPYVGGIVSFGSSSFDNGGSGNAEMKTSASTFGVAALAGFDWFFTRGLCVGGEMSLGFHSTSSSITSDGSTSDAQGSSFISLATGGSVHLDVYF